MTQNENITLYPAPETVFTDPSLALYFKPLFSTTAQANGKSYSIHMLCRDGLICKEEPAYQYAENYCFGFRYHEGRYEFIGDLQVFEGSDYVPALYRFLQEDFEQKKDGYLKNKTTVKEYLQGLRNDLQAIPGLHDETYTEIYARSFYSYEFTRYYYQKYGTHRHISVVTEQWAKNTDPFLLDKEDAQDIMEEWLEGFEEDTEYQYGITTNSFVAGTESRRFTALAGSSVVLALLDADKELVYMVEYTS